jgi:ABC-type multidrug transport system fused ATPase/permease subunit
MFWNNEKFGNNLYNFVDKIEKYESQMKLLPVDFQKPWWDIIRRQKWTLFLVAGVEVLVTIADTLLPLAVGYAIQNRNLWLFVGIVGFRLLLTWIFNITFHYNTIFQIQIMESVEYAANKFFLTVDPVYHSTKSSGQIVSKVNRGSSSYENILDIVTFEILPFLTGFGTVILTMFAFGWQLGVVASGFIIIITVFNILSHVIRGKIFEPIEHEAEDKVKAVGLESLQQATFVRTSFAVTELLQKYSKFANARMIKTGNNWQSGTYVNAVTRTLYQLSYLCVGLVLFKFLDQNLLTPIACISIILTYSTGTNRVLYIGNQVKRLTKGITSVTDLFTFIRGFGKQTYPVLKGEEIQS